MRTIGFVIAFSCLMSVSSRAVLAAKQIELLMVDGVSREVIVYVPARWPLPAAARPAVLMFHGTSGDGEKFFDISGWREKADAEGLVAVFPSALTHCLKEDDNQDGDFDNPGEAKVTTKWADGQLGDPLRMPLCTPEELAALPEPKRRRADHPLADDLAFVGAIIDLLTARYQVDPRRVYASGFSSGGNFTARLAQQLSDRLAAVAVASGRPQLPAVPSARPISVLVSVGNADDKLNADLGIPSLPMSETLLAEVPAISARVIVPMLTMLQLLDLPVFGARTVSGKPVVQLSYDTSVIAAGNVLHFVVIEGLGHQYPNGRNHPVVAADLLWRFFQGKSL
jgi:polyhydroxybutyrate depolymerase